MAALWANLDVVDIFATDHAPHTLAEKGIGASTPPSAPPPGVPGVETMLPLLLTAVHAGRLALTDITTRCIDAPQRIYGIPVQPDTYIEVDVDTPFVLRNEALLTKVGWSPFADQTLYGQVERVILRGELAYANGTVLAAPGSGHVLFV